MAYQSEQQGRELTAAMAVAWAVSAEPMDPIATLARALKVTMEVTSLPAGWVWLVPEGGGEPALATSAGLNLDIVRHLNRLPSPECMCKQALDSSRPLVVYPLHETCPIQALDLGDGVPPTCHIVVPLVAHTKVLGVLNLAAGDPATFDERKLSQLATLGQILGVGVENARLWEELKARDASRAQLLEQTIAYQEEERRHFARELHDRTGQALTSILVWLHALETDSGGRGDAVIDRRHLVELKSMIVDALDDVHNLAAELRPTMLDDLGLVTALERYVRLCRERYQLAIDFQPVGLDGMRLPPPVETALYRVAQEALTNVAQHARANSASLLLALRGRTVVLVVEDDGCGFDTSRLTSAPADETLLGLLGMQERAALLGGSFSIESTPGAGTTLYVEIPLDGETTRNVRR